MRLLIYIFIEFWLFPWQILAIIVYAIKIWRKTAPANISGTANEPVFTRVMLHQEGAREDEAAVRLAPHLPALGPVVAALIGTLGLASRWSGTMITWVTYPAVRPT
jgi:hypothetical protein